MCSHATAECSRAARSLAQAEERVKKIAENDGSNYDTLKVGSE